MLIFPVNVETDSNIKFIVPSWTVKETKEDNYTNTVITHLMTRSISLSG